MARAMSRSAEKVDSLLKSMLVLARTVHEVFEVQAVETSLGRSIGTSKAQVIRLLGHRGSQTAGQLTHFLGVTKPAVSQIIASLVLSRLVTRRTATEDRREVIVELTKQGQRAFRALLREQRHLVRLALAVEGRRDGDRWLRTLDEMTTCLAQVDAIFERFCLQCHAHADDTCVLVGGHHECAFRQHSDKVRRPKARGRVRRTATAKLS